MARYEHLPIYRKTMEIATYLDQLIGGFASRHKYGFGARIQTAVQGVLVRVIRVQNTAVPERVAELKELRVEVEVLKTLLHLEKVIP